MFSNLMSKNEQNNALEEEYEAFSRLLKYIVGNVVCLILAFFSMMLTHLSCTDDFLH